MQKTFFSIIIVSWNVRELILRALRTILLSETAVSFEVIVIDNASTDDTVRAVAAEFPQVKLQANSTNVGFAAACRQGVSLSSGEFLLFLNDDIELFPDTLEKFYQVCKQRPAAGVIGGKLMNTDGSVQASVRKFPDLLSMSVLLLKLHHIFPSLLAGYLQKDFDYGRPQPVDQVMGAFFGTPRTVWEKLSGFDRNFFIWFEEVDYCRRAKFAHYEVWYDPQPRLLHHGQASFSQLRAWPEQRLFNRSLLLYARKHFPWWQAGLLYCLVPLNLCLSGLVALGERYVSVKKS